MKKDTRELLLDSGFKEFYKNGYQGSSVAKILNEVGINKGSMYHFFKSKKDLALGVIKERIEINLKKKYAVPLEGDETFKALFSILKEAPQTLKYGCPLNKMAQEMSYLDEDFRVALVQVYEVFEKSVQSILEKAIKNKEIKECDTLMIAKLIIVTYEGALMVYHLKADEKEFNDTLRELQIQFCTAVSSK